jgi:hypothetical protein
VTGDEVGLREADWTSIVYAVERGTCTLMLGPDAMTGTFDGAQLPVHEALASFVRDQLGPAWEHLDPSKPWSVAQAAVMQEDPFTLHAWVREFYERFETDTDMLADLAQLPFELIVNTAPGPAASQAFLAVKPATRSDFYDRTAPARPTMPDATAQSPLVYHLYGSLEQPSSLILTESDRLAFIVSVVADEPPLPPKLRSMLCDPERSFLFLGFDLAHWQFKLLMHVLSGDTQRRYKSFAFERRPEALEPETCDFYRSGHKIHFVGGDSTAFARELRTRVRVPEAPASTPAIPVTPVAPVSTSSGDLPPDAPLVFLCHASEDKPFVQQVSDGLRANGIDTWFDRDDLAGGDDWDPKIRRVLDEVDYVVVLQSASLRAKEVSYVNREIDLALDRQQLYRAPRVFVIPAVIDSFDNALYELQDLQWVDLTVPSGLDSLVRAIRRDLNHQARAG